MPYRLFGRCHAMLAGARTTLARQTGQGTVEYIALILFLALVFAAVATFSGGANTGKEVAGKITAKIKETIDDVGKKN